VKLFGGRPVRAILTYHSIDQASTPISVSPSCFERHIAWLTRSAVRVLPLPELFRTTDAEQAVSITFDDALGSVSDIAAPILAAHGLTATVFVPTARVGLDNRWRGTGDRGIPMQRIMTWDEIAVLLERGWTIGAHTRSHPRLVECDDRELVDELAGAAEDIRTHTGQQPRTFAYPYGALNDRVCRAAGQVYDLCCTTDLRVLSDGEDRTALPRLDAYYLQTPGLLERWGSARQLRYLGFRRVLRELRQRLL
jgi:peptidoglycan/xylan/chitin deacetylase (PgdA/CDA1 family)